MHPDFEKKAPKTVEVRGAVFLILHSHFPSMLLLIRCHTHMSITDVIVLQRANILKEVQIMRQLDHPNVTSLVDFSESKQYYYIILELCPGGELFHQIVRLTYFSEELSRHVITQVANALDYLHEDAGVVHRSVPQYALLNVQTADRT